MYINQFGLFFGFGSKLLAFSSFPTQPQPCVSKHGGKSLKGDDTPRPIASKWDSPAWTPARGDLPCHSAQGGRDRIYLSCPMVTCVFTQSERITALSQSHPLPSIHLEPPRWWGLPTPTAQEKQFRAQYPPTFKLDISFFKSLKGGGRYEPAWAKETRGRQVTRRPRRPAARARPRTHLSAGTRGGGTGAGATKLGALVTPGRH